MLMVATNVGRAMAGNRAVTTCFTMEMHQVRYFLAVCAEKSFTRAARRCAVKPSSLGKAIGRLERAFGTALFVSARDGADRVELTDLGRLLQSYFVRIERALGPERNLNKPERHGQPIVAARRT
jgi:DNA-binding transcriptional LysR family regulator